MAQKVKFTKDYTYPVSFGKEVAYKKGREYLIPDAHHEAAKEAGAIEPVSATEAKTETKAKG